MKLFNKKIFLTLQDYFYMNGEYFKIILYKNNKFFFYNYSNHINCINLKNLRTYTILKDVFSNGFEIIEKDNELYLFLGTQSNKVLDKVYREKKITKPKNKTRIKNYISGRNEEIFSHLIKSKYPINGIYIYKSNDGIKWEKITKNPIMHRFFDCNNIKLGEIDFDTKPSIIKFNDEYIYYGRLNSNRQERKIYLRKSKNLFNWEDPKPINIINETETNEDIKNNYYHLVPFIYKRKLYGLTPYFKSILKKNHNEYKDGCTLIMQSNNGIDWRIIAKMLRFEGKYRDRVNDVKIINNNILVYNRDNINQSNPIFVKYNLVL